MGTSGGRQGWYGVGTDLRPGLGVGYLPGNLTIVPGGQTEWGKQRAQELEADVTQNRPARHSQTRGEFPEHGFFSTRSSKGHRGGSPRTEGGRGKGQSARAREGCCGPPLGRQGPEAVTFQPTSLEITKLVLKIN